MKITLAFLADLAKADSGGKVNAIGIFNQIRTNEFPVRIPPCGLVLMFDMMGDDLTVVRNLTVRLRGGEPEDVYMMEDTEMKFPPVLGPDEVTSAQMIATIREGPALKSPGVYLLEFFIDKEIEYVTSFRVFQKAEGSAA